MKKEITLFIINALIVLLFFYAGFSKVSDHDAFIRAMGNQPLPVWLRVIVINFLPVTEIIVAAMLLFDKSQLLGLCFFVVLMIGFTLYIAAGLLNLLAFTPCSCGGVISAMSWPVHLFFNLFFIAIAIYAIWLTKKIKPVN